VLSVILLTLLNQILVTY